MNNRHINKLPIDEADVTIPPIPDLEKEVAAAIKEACSVPLKKTPEPKTDAGGR